MKLILATMLYLITLSVQADTTCVVTKAIDGDTVDAMCDKTKTRIRLTSIDSYESKRNNRAYKQAYIQQITVDEVIARGHRAALITKQTLEGKQVILVTPKNPIDVYGRTLGELYINGIDVNTKLLQDHPDVFLKY
jgi:endonuclease YncB( thermonuclease family)